MIVVTLLVIGLSTGALATVLGVGGGIIFVPTLVALFDFSQKVAQGTSLAVIAPTALIATFVSARAGQVSWPAALPMAVGAVVGAVAGSQAAQRLDDAVLRRLFAVLLVIVALRMLWRTLRRSY